MKLGDESRVNENDFICCMPKMLKKIPLTKSCVCYRSYNYVKFVYISIMRVFFS